MGCCAHVRTRVPGAITPVLRNALVSHAAVMSWGCPGTSGATVASHIVLPRTAVRLLGDASAVEGPHP